MPVPETQSQAPAVDDPKALLASANDASGPARNAWLAFLGLLAYLLVTLAGVTHVDLLLNSPVTLPIVNVKIPLFSFFLAAPFLLLLVHLGLLVQHAILAHKYQQFSAAIAVSEEAQTGDHPDRQLVHNYVFSQIVAGPKPPWPLHMLMRLMVFVTFSLLPVLVLLYFQIKFLPYHDVAITHAHRIAILLNVVLLFGVRPFVAMPHLWSHRKILSLGNQSWRWEISYAGFGIGGALCLVVVSFSLLVATVPQACFWPFEKYPEEPEVPCFSLDTAAAQLRTRKVVSGNQAREVFAPTKWLFEGKLNETSGTPESLFSRNLIVTDKDLVAKKDFENGETSLQLRGRDLRFAVLDRSDLHSADLYNSDLRGASAIATRLDHAELEKANLQGAKLKQANLEEANLRLAELQGAVLNGAKLQGADFRGAKMQDAELRQAEMPRADLSGANLRGADLSEAKMQGADLREAKMWGAVLSSTKMQGADLRNAEMPGVDFHHASLQGADLGQAYMLGANFNNADMQGVNFFAARMQGADLMAAKMQGANLHLAHLQGVNLWHVDLQGADLSEALICHTAVPNGLSNLLAMQLDEIKFVPINDTEKSVLKKLITEAKRETLREELDVRFRPLLDADAAQKCKGSPEYKAWQKFSERPRTDPDDLSKYLAELACSDNSGGYIIRGIARRFVTRASDYAKPTAKRLINTETCPAAKHLSKETLASLRKIAIP